MYIVCVHVCACNLTLPALPGLNLEGNLLSAPLLTPKVFLLAPADPHHPPASERVQTAQVTKKERGEVFVGTTTGGGDAYLGSEDP